VQRPRPPIWVGATLGRRAPLQRARRWDGVFPVTQEAGPPTPEQLGDMVADLEPPSGYDVVGVLTPQASTRHLAAAGATWSTDGPAGPDDPLSEVRRRIEAGPPRRTVRSRSAGAPLPNQGCNPGAAGARLPNVIERRASRRPTPTPGNGRARPRSPLGSRLGPCPPRAAGPRRRSSRPAR